MENNQEKKYSEMDVKELFVALSSNLKNGHDKPSPETMSNINNINLKITSMEDKLDNVVKGMEVFHADNKEQHTKIFDLCEKIENKKADKEVVNEIKESVEKINANLGKVVWIIIGAVIVAVLALVIKQ